MIESIFSRIEDDYLLITVSANIASDEDYRSFVKRCIDEIEKSGLEKIIIDETNVKYAPSLLLQMDIVKFYSSEEVPKEINNWKIASIGPHESMAYFEFWADTAQRAGYNQKAFDSIENAREYMKDI